MTDTWVVNASPIIVLAKADLLEVLQESVSHLLVPQPVADEILRGPPDDPARAALESGWADRCAPRHVPEVLTEWGLGEGETAVLATAIERPGASAVLDDAAARRCAKAFGVPVIGTLGVLLRAERLRLLPSFAEVLPRLRSAGFYLDSRLVDGLIRDSRADQTP